MAGRRRVQRRRRTSIVERSEKTSDDEWLPMTQSGSESGSDSDDQLPRQLRTRCETPPAAENAMDQSNCSRSTWTHEEDNHLRELVQLVGVDQKRWAAIARCVGGRTGKQCRDRWVNHLDPKLKRTPWTNAEEIQLRQLHKQHGNKWAAIAKSIPGRSENSIKNHWNRVCCTTNKHRRTTYPGEVCEEDDLCN